MMHHKLTKLVYSNKPYVLLYNVLYLDFMLYHYFLSTEQKNFNYWTTGLRLQWKFSWWAWLITIITCYRAFLGLFFMWVFHTYSHTVLFLFISVPWRYRFEGNIDFSPIWLRIPLVISVAFYTIVCNRLRQKARRVEYAFFSIHIHVLWRFSRHSKFTLNLKITSIMSSKASCAFSSNSCKSFHSFS